MSGDTAQHERSTRGAWPVDEDEMQNGNAAPDAGLPLHDGHPHRASKESFALILLEYALAWDQAFQ